MIQLPMDNPIQESQHTSNRVKESLRSRARKGLFKGSSPTYGYAVNLSFCSLMELCFIPIFAYVVIKTQHYIPPLITATGFAFLNAKLNV